MKTDVRLPYTEIDDGFLPPRDPVLGYIKVGGRDATIRYARGTGRPWVAPTRFLDPARFEITSREKRTKKVKGKPGTSAAGEDFTLDLGYVRDTAFHEHEDVGQAPSALRIRLLYPRWNQNLIAFLGAYGSGAWVCRGNGVEATDIKRGECVCPCPRLIQFSGKYEGTKPADKLICKPHAVLNVMLEDAGVFGGFWAFKTTSYETISNLTKSLRMFEEMFGRIDGLPLELRVMATTKSLPGGGTTVQPIVTLVLPASMDGARQLAKDAATESRKYLPAGGELDETKYLEAVADEMEAEAESYAGEFLPEGEVLEAEDVEEPDEEPADERGDGPEGSGGRHPSPPDEPQAEDGPELDEEREAEEPPLGAVDDSDRNDPDPPVRPKGIRPPNDPQTKVDDSDRDYDEELATKVLEVVGWELDAIQGRLAYHRKTGTIAKLLERLERGHPEAWAKVMQPELDEPDDGLKF